VEYAGIEARLRGLLGLSGYEARAYLALLRLGRAQPREVARESGVPQQRVYDVLRSLEWRGLVKAEGPYYAPVPPEEALAAEGERRILEARKQAEELAALARELAGLSRQQPSGESVLLIHGLESALAWASAILESCPERPLFSAYKALERLGDLWPLLRELLARLAERGVGALVVVPRSASIPPDALEEARSLGVEVHRAPCVTLDYMVACDRVVIGLPGPGGGVVGVVVRSREFAEALKKVLFEALEGCEGG